MHLQMSSPASNMFDKMEIDDDEAAAVVAASIDELELYLREPRVKGITDVLRWWALNAGKYPILSRVALDKLACPRPFLLFLSFSRHVSNISDSATSVYVERQFSRSRLLVSSIRNRLSAESIRQMMCLGCWSRQGFVEDEDFKVVASLPTVEEEEEEEAVEED